MAAAQFARPAGAQTPEPVALRVGAAPDDQSKPILYAVQSGMFARAGLNVTLVPLTGGGAAIAAAVSGGSLDLGKANVLLLLTAHTKGLPFTIVAPGTTTGAEDRGVGLIVAKDSSIRSGRDLNGKTVGVTSLVTIELIATRAYIDGSGGDSSSVHFVEVPPSASLASIESGRIDATTILEPHLSAALASGKVRIVTYPYGSIAKVFDGADWFTTQAWAEAHPEVLERFERVIHDANLYVAAHETETIPLIAAYSGIDPATLANMKHAGRPAYLNAGYIQPLIAAAYKYKFIPAPFPAADLISKYALKPSR